MLCRYCGALTGRDEPNPIKEDSVMKRNTLVLSAEPVEKIEAPITAAQWLGIAAATLGLAAAIAGAAS